MAVDLTKHDIAINSVGFRLGSYQKAEASSFVPRFNTGADNENHLDFWKEISLTDFRGGSFQNDMEDLTKCTFGMGVPVAATGRLHSNNVPRSITYSNSGKMVSAWVVFNANLYFCTDDNQLSSSASTFWKMDTNQAFTNPSGFPAALSTNNYITDMCVFEDKIYFASKTGNVQQWDGTTWTAHSTRLEKLCVFRDVLHGIAEDGGLHSLSGTTWSLVKRFGQKAIVNAPLNMVEFNGRLYIGKAEGLYAYDGVQVVRVLDLSNSQYATNTNFKNFRLMRTFQGNIYYTVQNKLYRFNGVTVEKVLDNPRLDFWAMTEAKDCLYVRVSNTDLAQFENMIPSGAISDTAVYTLRFDGTTWTYFCSIGDTFNYVRHSLMTYQDTLYMESGKPSTAPIFYYNYLRYDGSDTNGQKLSWLSSEITMSLPEVRKYLHKLDVTLMPEFDYGANAIVTGTPSVKAGIYSVDPADSYDFTSSSYTNSFDIFTKTTTTEHNSFKFRIYVEVTVADGSVFSLKDVSLRYALQPQYRNKWDLSVLCYGSSLEPLELKDGTTESVAAATLRETIYDARRQPNPIEFVDCDFDQLNGAVNNAVTTLTLDDTATLAESGIVLIGTEKIKYTAKTATTLTGCTRGYLGSTATSHSDNDKVYMLYLSQISRIVNERIIIQDTNAVNGKHVSEIQLQIEQAT